MTQIHQQSLLQKVQATLARGETVAIIGWKGSNHNALTRKFLRSKQVSFHFELKNNLGQNTGFAMRTRFSRHASRDRLKSRGIELYPGLVTIGVIKQTFKSCEDLLVVKASQSATTVKEQPVMKDENKDASAPPPSDAPITAAKSAPTDDMSSFARAFLELARAHDGIVGIKFLARLREEHGIERNAQQLLRAGWLEPYSRPGREKIGGYKAGPKMLNLSFEEAFEPDGPVEKAEFLIAQEPSLLKEQAELASRIAEINRQLERIKKAKDILRQLDDV